MSKFVNSLSELKTIWSSICLFFVLYYINDFFVCFFFFFGWDCHSPLEGKNWNTKGKKKKKPKKKVVSCTGRESNPGLPRGRREFYHWTTSAQLTFTLKIVRFKHKKIQTRLKYFTCLALLVFHSVKCPNTSSFFENHHATRSKLRSWLSLTRHVDDHVDSENQSPSNYSREYPLSDVTGLIHLVYFAG